MARKPLRRREELYVCFKLFQGSASTLDVLVRFEMAEPRATTF